MPKKSQFLFCNFLFLLNKSEFMLTDALMKCMIRLSKGRKELRGLKLYQFAYFAPGQGLG